ncbi:OB-fold domain-containing protein [Acidiferrimicrobium sp. IK]|uniref:Zn-ribbon domain-containing OB-fold protein n=1 Tax=Acidiferrimicrobium sp. IK TaxID=2871700 RepID=UPI0021CB4192|nr:OB-fold domain-containing protein [Acidiferrimicrobium sp. IK]MCU4186358.1 OB-fold domain-containing protein [Acidiferrimicrobium sp. IK]
MSAPAPPTPAPGAISEFFWSGARRGQLMIQRCQACGTYIHLPRPVCRACHSFDLLGEPVSGRGSLYSFTETHRPFHPFFVDRVPYLVAVVELEEQAGLRVLTNLVRVAEADVRIGMAVQVEFERLSDDLTIPVFAPAVAA